MKFLLSIIYRSFQYNANKTKYVFFFPNFNLKIVKNVTFHCISSLYLPLTSQACSRCFNVILTTLQALFSTWVLIKVVFFFIFNLKAEKKKMLTFNMKHSHSCLVCSPLPPPPSQPPHTKRRHHSFLRLTDRDKDSSVKQTAIN